MLKEANRKLQPWGLTKKLRALGFRRIGGLGIRRSAVSGFEGVWGIDSRILDSCCCLARLNAARGRPCTRLLKPKPSSCSLTSSFQNTLETCTPQTHIGMNDSPKPMWAHTHKGRTFFSPDDTCRRSSERTATWKPLLPCFAWPSARRAPRVQRASEVFWNYGAFPARPLSNFSWQQYALISTA